MENLNRAGLILAERLSFIVMSCPTRTFIVAALLITASFSVLKASGQPATTQAAESAPAATPSEAYGRMVEAYRAVDEAAYRRIVQFNSPAGYAEQYARMLFAGQRLKKARQIKHLVNREDTRESATEEKMLAAAKQIEWVIAGNTASPKNERPSISGTQGHVTVERRGNGWCVSIADPGPPNVPGIDTYTALWRTTADAMEAATRRVEAGDFSTVEAVTDFVQAERKRMTSDAVGKAGTK